MLPNAIRTMMRESWSLSWPLTFIMFYEFLIGIADVYVASKFGTAAQAAYGVAFQLYFIFIFIGIALSVGAVSVVARLFTAREPSKFGAAVGSSLGIAALCGGLFGIAGIGLCAPVMHALNVPSAVAHYAIPFTQIYALAFFFDYVLMNTNGILRSCGMVRQSLVIMTLVCAMNIVLNFILAFNTPLGLYGIAVATVISIGCGAVLSLIPLRRLRLRMRIDLSLIREIVRISWPSGVLQALWQLGALILFAILSMLPQQAVVAMAALTNGLKIESAIFLPAFAFNMAAAVIVGNFLGKQDRPGAFHAGIVTAVMGVAVVTVLTIFIMLHAGRIAAFLSGDASVISESVRYIYIALLFEPVMAWAVILGGALNGAGDTISVMWATALSVWLARLPLCYLGGIMLGGGTVAIWWAMNASIVVQAVIITRRYYSKRWAV